MILSKIVFSVEARHRVSPAGARRHRSFANAEEFHKNIRGGKNMNLPKDPVMLLSVVNTQLRDHYASLAEMAAAYMVDADEIIAKLDAINYHYDEKQNQFI